MLTSYLQPKNKTRLPPTGFSLIETLVAIAILLLMTSGMMSVVHQTTSSSQAITNRLSANYLAADAIEYLRSDRDTYWLNNNDATLDGWVGSSGLDSCTSTSNICRVDTRLSDESYNTCDSGGCQPLNVNTNSNLYGYGSGSNWEETPFVRSFQIETESHDGNSGAEEIIVTVTVTWDDGQRSATLKDSLTAWGDQD